MQYILSTNAKEISKIAEALTSELRLTIIQHLCIKEMSVKELHNILTSIRYRDTIYRHLELLKAVGLLEKYYDDKTKELKYKLAYDSITIVFKSGSCANVYKKEKSL